MDKNLKIKTDKAASLIVASEDKDCFTIAHIDWLQDLNVEAYGIIVSNEYLDFGDALINPEEQFFYTADFFKKSNSEHIVSEAGIGRHDNGIIYKTGVLHHIVNGIKSDPKRGGYNFKVMLEEDAYGIIATYSPTSLHELLIKPNSVIASDDDPGPNFVTVDEFSVLGRLGGNLRSINISDIFTEIPNKLKSFFCKKIKCDSLIVAPSSRASKEIGSIYFNKKDTRLELFNGEKWIEIATKDIE